MANQTRPWETVDVPEEMRSDASYAVVQWINQPSRLSPPQSNGGFFVARKYGGVELPGGTKAQYHEDAGTFATNLTACLLAMRVAWVRKEAGVEIRLSGYQDGARKRVEFLMLLLDEQSGNAVGPVKLTTVGTANKELTINYQALASTAKAAGAEPFMFWVDLQAGQTQRVGSHGVTMTPITVSVPDADELDDAFVGVAVLNETIFPLSDELNKWREAWNGDNISDEAEYDALTEETEHDTCAEEDEDADGGMSYEQALQVKVNTKSGWQAFGKIIQDTEYARRVIDYVLDPANNLSAKITAAAEVIDNTLFGDEPTAVDDEEEIPF